jgi:hypothetical protein
MVGRTGEREVYSRENIRYMYMLIFHGHFEMLTLKKEHLQNFKFQ